MPINKKQGEFQINGRIFAVSTDVSALLSANVSAITTDIILDGVDVKLSTLDSTQQTAITAAVKALVIIKKGL